MVNKQGETKMATLTQQQLDILTQILLEDDTDSDDILEYCDNLRSIVHRFEEEVLDDAELDLDDKKVLFDNCMKTFADPELCAAYPLGFVRGLKLALEVTETYTLTF
jgi:hypothetical protein